jgi:hypothetical protein
LTLLDMPVGDIPRLMQRLLFAFALASCGRGQSSPASSVQLRHPGPNELLAAAEFDAVGDRETRSSALFTEASRVLLHPRCANCHPSGDTPHQRLTMELHDPPVVRGAEDNGVPGMECTSCHQDRNQMLTRVPGAPKWHLAPIEMAWVGKSVAYVCGQLKDPKRNGGRTLEQVVEHSAHDDLVAWGWSPGADREPAPGTQAQFGALMQAWVDTGAECPEESQ